MGQFWPVFFICPRCKSACLLGFPLNVEGIDEALIANVARLQEITPRLRMLTAHEVFHLLKVSFAVPRLQYLLRTAPVFSLTHCLALAEAVRDTLSGVLNLRWSEDSWAQASLPVRWGA